eukprot:s692_g9.t1
MWLNCNTLNILIWGEWFNIQTWQEVVARRMHLYGFYGNEIRRRDGWQLEVPRAEFGEVDTIDNDSSEDRIKLR